MDQEEEADKAQAVILRTDMIRKMDNQKQIEDRKHTISSVQRQTI